MENIQQLIGTKIKYYRNLKGYTIEDLAHKAKIDYSYLSKLERGYNNVSIQKLLQISLALDISIQQLFQYKNEVQNIDYKQEITLILNTLSEKDLHNLYNIVLSFNDSTNSSK